MATDDEVLQFIRALARSELEIFRPIEPGDDLLKDLARHVALRTTEVVQ